MPGSITPLPIMLEEQDRKAYEKLEPPKSMVVRYGYQRLIAELPHDGQDKPGCGSKLVIRTRRGIELGEMVTTLCGNNGCGSSISRKEMLEYIDKSGGKDYPFTNQGRILRVATLEDLADQAKLDARKPEIRRLTRGMLSEMNLDMHLVDVELLLGGERIIFHYTSENWIDFRELVKRLAGELQTRIEMHQVNAREEARIAADYERCGQHCCCKQFLKVLKPVSMRSAKVQKATLDPTKISGRCGRLMCCLRYEDETYETLRKRLPNKQSRVETPDGFGTVINTQILTQLVLVKPDSTQPPVAYPLENIRVLTKEEMAAWRAEQKQLREQQAAEEKDRADNPNARGHRTSRGSRPSRSPRKPDDAGSDTPQHRATEPTDAPADSSASSPPQDQPRAQGSGEGDGSPDQGETGGKKKRRRRRRRRRKGRGGDGGAQTGGGDGGA